MSSSQSCLKNARGHSKDLRDRSGTIIGISRLRGMAQDIEQGRLGWRDKEQERCGIQDMTRSSSVKNSTLAGYHCGPSYWLCVNCARTCSGLMEGRRTRALSGTFVAPSLGPDHFFTFPISKEKKPKTRGYERNGTDTEESEHISSRHHRHQTDTMSQKERDKRPDPGSLRTYVV